MFDQLGIGHRLFKALSPFYLIWFFQVVQSDTDELVRQLTNCSTVPVGLASSIGARVVAILVRPTTKNLLRFFQIRHSHRYLRTTHIFFSPLRRLSFHLVVLKEINEAEWIDDDGIVSIPIENTPHHQPLTCQRLAVLGRVAGHLRCLLALILCRACSFIFFILSRHLRSFSHPISKAISCWLKLAGNVDECVAGMSHIKIDIYSYFKILFFRKKKEKTFFSRHTHTRGRVVCPRERLRHSWPHRYSFIFHLWRMPIGNSWFHLCY